jgi:hypothetical protein
MRQITKLEDGVLYLIDDTEENCRLLSLKYKFNFIPNNVSSLATKDSFNYSIFWFSKNSSFPKRYRIDSDTELSSPFDYMEVFVKEPKFHSKRRVYIGSDLKFYDSLRARRLKKHKSRRLKDTK